VQARKNLVDFGRVLFVGKNFPQKNKDKNGISLAKSGKNKFLVKCFKKDLTPMESCDILYYIA